jgi:hypothetical protein
MITKTIILSKNVGEYNNPEHQKTVWKVFGVPIFIIKTNYF